ncbi:hypothetical protein [Haloarcula sp. CBA1127]|uniref:hypothetical protein n=1 Tax=Haloarcula sp. CBA1127 TaxID=1765055 RepID=UPI000A4194E4|nr:hypothetical protein [Haloarcula sp. CBA1127]
MTPTAKKPDIERITGRYIDAWELFGDEIFSAEELETELLRNRDPEDVPDSDKIDQDLYRVSVLGLVEWFGEGRYRVSIPPESDEEQWSDIIESQVSWVRSEIDARRDERRQKQDEPEERSKDEPEVLEYDGNRYMSAFVGPNSNLNSQARYYQAALSPQDHDGVVLRSYQGVANATTKLAEKICDDEKMSDTDCVYRFEISDEEMADVGDDLEYRVYLKETRLL